MAVLSITVGPALLLGRVSYLIAPMLGERARILAAEAPGYVRAVERMLSADPAMAHTLRRDLYDT